MPLDASTIAITNFEPHARWARNDEEFPIELLIAVVSTGSDQDAERSDCHISSLAFQESGSRRLLNMECGVYYS